MDKEYVSKYLKSLEKAGWMVYNFQSNHAMPRGAIGFPDYFLMKPDRGVMVLIELKLGKDKESEEQRKFAESIRTLIQHNDKISYYVANEENIVHIVERLVLV